MQPFSLWYCLTLKNQPDSFLMATKETGFHNMSLCLYQKEPTVHWISPEQVNLPSLFWDKEIRCICCACLHNCHVCISFSQWPFLANIAVKMLSIHWLRKECTFLSCAFMKWPTISSISRTKIDNFCVKSLHLIPIILIRFIYCSNTIIFKGSKQILPWFMYTVYLLLL